MGEIAGDFKTHLSELFFERQKKSKYTLDFSFQTERILKRLMQDLSGSGRESFAARLMPACSRLNTGHMTKGKE